MTSEDIRGKLTTRVMGTAVHLFDSLDSTNDTARGLARDGAPEGTLVVALEQKSGRGRQDRKWISEPGKNLTFSVILRPRIRPEFLGAVSLFASVGVAASVSAMAGKEAGCKWPNDVLVSGKKISGILCESAIAGGSVESVIVGIGLNVNQREFPGDIAEHATSLLIETGRMADLAAALSRVLGSLEEFYHPSDAGWPAVVASEWTKRNVILGSRVEVSGPMPRITGIARSVTATGALRIETDGRTVEVTAGDVHLL
jgi:BirA family biotin operon repressor/biotin-[acetyl-CoA-carboxylase] ligase